MKKSRVELDRGVEGRESAVESRDHGSHDILETLVFFAFHRLEH